MRLGIKAVYRNGVFKPLEKLELPDGTEVEIVVRKAGPILKKYAGILKKSDYDWEAEYYEHVQERTRGD
jgi:predicted DNA-binding antitoxin AbrB/MazE fold protein